MSNSRKPRNFRLTRRRGARIKDAAVDETVKIPNNEKTVIKVVPAKVNGESIGDAIIYDDGSVDIKVDPNADPELIAVVQGELDDFNEEYSTDFKQADLFGRKGD